MALLSLLSITLAVILIKVRLYQMKYVTIAERKEDGRVVHKLLGIKSRGIISETEEWGLKNRNGNDPDIHENEWKYYQTNKK